MPSFNVESYTVSVGANVHLPSDPSIRLVSPDLGHGIRYQVSLVFQTNPDQLENLGANGYLTNVGGLNINDIQIVAYISRSVFDDIYNIVRQESPIQLVFNYKNIPNNNSTTKLLTYIKIGTESEIPGEGNTDSDLAVASIQQILQAG